MISFTLSCADGHRFEGWFRSGSDFEETRSSGHVTCPTCGSAQVEKTVMAPAIARSAESTPPDPARLRELRKRIERNTEDVGERFAVEARAIHLGDRPERAIRGRASLEEVKSLHEDGIPAFPLPDPAMKRLN